MNMDFLYKLKSLRQDLANHYVYGSLIFSVTFFTIIILLTIGNHFDLTNLHPLTITLISTINAELATILTAKTKEYYDKKSGKGTASAEDFWHTIYGTFPLLLVIGGILFKNYMLIFTR